GGSGGGGGGGGAGGGGSRSNQEEPYEIKPGDNLWSIARAHLAKARSGGSGEPTNREVAEYWMRVVEANRDRLESGDPDLIYPREKIVLPPVD
ncbi:MAG TPA: LysM peptidoglycan-binding domain-containing protein, partial [Actinomycetota bacterium]|nr:LysM peptidoglycan-binding domain-containing protein [Actinomycetota bacterium]